MNADLLDKILQQMLKTAQNLDYQVIIADHLGYVLLNYAEVQEILKNLKLIPNSFNKVFYLI